MTNSGRCPIESEVSVNIMPRVHLFALTRRWVEAGICTVGSTILPFIRNWWEASIYLLKKNYLGHYLFISKCLISACLDCYSFIARCSILKPGLKVNFKPPTVLKLPSVAANVQSITKYKSNPRWGRRAFLYTAGGHFSSNLNIKFSPIPRNKVQVDQNLK